MCDRLDLFDPVPVFAGDHRQRIAACEDSAVIGLSHSAAHAGASGALPDRRHALASVATIAADAWLFDEYSAANTAQIPLVQVATGRAKDLIAVVEQEAELIRVPKVVERGNLHFSPAHSFVQVVDHLIGGVVPDEANVQLPGAILDGL